MGIGDSRQGLEKNSDTAPGGLEDVRKEVRHVPQRGLETSDVSFVRLRCRSVLFIANKLTSDF